MKPKPGQLARAVTLLYCIAYERKERIKIELRQTYIKRRVKPLDVVRQG